MIALKGAALKRGSFTLGPLKLEIRSGERVAIMGKNGSGKTSLFDAISLMDPLTSGKAEISERIAYVPEYAEDSFFLPTVHQEILYSLKGLERAEAEKRVMEVLSLVSLDSSFLDRSPFSLSGGEKRLISIAAAMALRPSFILFDESFSGLDGKGVKALRKLFSHLSESNTGYILITHDSTDLDLADRLLVMDGGKIVFDGEPQSAMEKGLVEKSFAYRKSMELFGKAVLSLDELIGMVKNG